MASKIFADQMISNVESVLNRQLNDDERGEIELWNKGRALSQIVGTYGWEVLQEMFAQYVFGETEHLLSIDPGNKEAVMAAHATAFAAKRIFNILLQDVNAAVEAARQTPQSLISGLKNVSAAPVESL